MNVEFEPEKFIRWINAKYDAWRMGDPRKKITHFAKYVGVSSQVMSNWLLGKVRERPSEESWQKLLKFYGEEVYDALNLSRPNPDLVRFFKGKSPVQIAKSAEAMKDFMSWILATGTEINSPEADRMLNDLFIKHGVNNNLQD